MIKIDLIEAIRKQVNYCKHLKNYKCGVFVNTNVKAEIVRKLMADIIDENNERILSSVIYNGTATFLNGNIMKIVHASDSARGNRFNGLIVDNDISKNVLDCVVYPVLVPIYNEEKHEYEPYNTVNDKIHIVSISSNDIKKYEDEKAKFDVLLYVPKMRGLRASNICIDEYIGKMFEKEYESMFYENDYDRPVVEKELNGDKVMLYEAWGIPKDVIKYETEFVNKTKRTYLNVTGQAEMKDIGFENNINIHLLIDTDIYDRFKVIINDGMVMIVLHEIENEKPILKDCSIE